jgi:hypothetical protein
VAGCSGLLWAVADGVWLVSALATQRDMEEDPGRTASSCGRGGVDRLGCECGFHGLSGAPARGGCAEKGDLQVESPGGVDVEPADHGLGRSRGGFSTKTHLATEQGQKPLSLVVTAGQRGDSPQFTAVLEGICVARIGPGRPRTTPDRVLGDKAYSSRANRTYLRQRGIACTIPEPADQIRNRKNKGRRGGRPPTFDPEIYTTPRRGVRHQPPQTQPRRRDQVRQTCRPLRSRPRHRLHQRVAMTSETRSRRGIPQHPGSRT